MIDFLRQPDFSVEFWYSRVSIGRWKLTFLKKERFVLQRVTANGVVILVKLHVSMNMCKFTSDGALAL